jgi:hypothetical protein
MFKKNASTTVLPMTPVWLRQAGMNFHLKTRLKIVSTCRVKNSGVQKLFISAAEIRAVTSASPQIVSTNVALFSNAAWAFRCTRR